MTSKEKIAKKKERLNMYYIAEEKIICGAQSYELGTRSLTRANLSEIRKVISALESEIAELEKIEKGRKPRQAFAIVPRDF